MIDLKVLVSEPEKVRESFKKRNNEKLISALDQVIELDKKRRSGLQEVEVLKARRNEASAQISQLKKNKGVR